MNIDRCDIKFSSSYELVPSQYTLVCWYAERRLEDDGNNTP